MATDLNDVVEKAMSDEFRAYTGTKVGEDMWNLNMERTWAIVRPAAITAVRAEVAEEIAQDALSRDEALNGLTWQQKTALIARKHAKES